MIQRFTAGFLVFAFQLTNICGAVSSTGLESMSGATEKFNNNWQALKARNLRLLPVPKEIAFEGEPVPVEKLVIVIEHGHDKSTDIAVNEITSRVEELCGFKIPVVDAIQEGHFNVVIDHRYPNFFSQTSEEKVTANNPFCIEQAYGIEVFPGGLRLAGNSPLATIYSAVTVRYLIAREGDQVLLYPANVTDWPDFPRRLVSGFLAPYHYKDRNDPEKHLANMKKHVDWALRLKCNMVSQHTYVPYFKTCSPLNDAPLANETLYASGSAVGEYMKERGIYTLAGIDVALAYENEKDRPEVKEMFYNPIHKRYYSWANTKLHELKARKLAEAYSKLGYGSVFVHAVDGGGFSDPELWSKRDLMTRNKYGDNRLQANIDMFKIYIDTMKKYGLEPQLVVYPYSARNLDLDASLKSLGLADTKANRELVGKQIGNISEFMRAFNDGIPKDVPVCVREAKSEFMSRYYKNYPGRPIQIYYEVLASSRDIHSLLPAEISTFSTAYDPERQQNDIIWLNMPRKFLEQASVCGAEYAWNTQFPGHMPLDRSLNPVNYDPAVLDIMAERAAVGLWGAQAGQYLKNVFNQQLSFFLAYAPEETTKTLNLKSILPLLENNCRAAQAAEKAMAEVWKLVQNDRGLIDAFSYPLFVTYYKMVQAAKAYASVHYYMALGNEAARAGDMEKVARAIQAGKETLAADEVDYRRVIEALKNEPELISYDDLRGWWRNPPVNVDSNLLNPDFIALAEKLADLASASVAIFEQYNVPDWFEAFINKNSVVAFKTAAGTEIEIDGVPNEDAWDLAIPVEYFVNDKSLRLPAEPVVMKLLYDSKKVYFSGRISQRLMSELNYSGDGQCDFSESIEIFLQPNIDDKNTYFQLALDAWGHLFALHKEIKGVKTVENFKWRSGVEYKTENNSDGWTFEMAIPFASLDANVSSKMAVMVCYNGTEKTEPRNVVGSYSSSLTEGKGFHDPDIFKPLLLRSHAVLPDAHVNVRCSDCSMEGVTHESGSGSLVKFNIELTTRRPLYDLELSARFLDQDKQPIGSEMVIEAKAYLPLSWKNASPLYQQLLIGYDAIYLELNVKYKTLGGVEKVLTKTFIVGDKNSILTHGNPYRPGITEGSQGIAGPFYFDTVFNGAELLNPQKGTIEFWVKPEFEIHDQSLESTERNVLFHCGPIRPEHPMNYNLSSINASFIPRYGSVNFAISSEKYQSSTTHAMIRDWKPGHWYHLAFVWNLEDPPARMEIYVEGKLASEKNESLKLLENNAPAYPVQFGAMNSGEGLLNGVLDGLCISALLKYKRNFTPNPKETEGNVIFCFDDNLDATEPAGLKAHRGVMLR